jgi:hypothetical protein
LRLPGKKKNETKAGLHHQRPSNFNARQNGCRLGLRQMIDRNKARWTGIICALLGHKRILLTQYQDGYFLWACERCGYRDWEFRLLQGDFTAGRKPNQRGYCSNSLGLVVKCRALCRSCPCRCRPMENPVEPNRIMSSDSPIGVVGATRIVFFDWGQTCVDVSCMQR